MLGNYRLYTQCVWGAIHSGANMPVMSHEALMSWGPLHSNPIIIEDDERVTSGRGIDGWTSDLDWSRGVFEDELGSRLQTSENCSKAKNYCWKGVDLYSKFSWRIKENITVRLFSLQFYHAGGASENSCLQDAEKTVWILWCLNVTSLLYIQISAVKQFNKYSPGPLTNWFRESRYLVTRGYLEWQQTLIF